MHHQTNKYTSKFVKDHTFKPERDAELAALLVKIQAYGIPKTWSIQVAAASITLVSPKGTRVIKCDSYHTLTIDRIKGLDVKSTRFTCKTMDEVWRIIEQTLNAFIKITKEVACTA